MSESIGSTNRSGDIHSVQPVEKPPSRTSKGLAITGTVIGVAAIALGTIAVVAFFISPHALPHALMWIEKFQPMGAYSFVLLGGGVTITLISAIALFKIRGKRARSEASKPMADHAIWSRDVAYTPKNGKPEEVNCSSSYASPQKGYGFVFQAPGSDNPEKSPEISKALDKLIESYHPVTKASSVEEAHEQIMEQLQSFTNTMSYPILSGSDVSFCQIVEVKGQKYLISLQWAETYVVIQSKEGEINWIDSPHKNTSVQGFGFGHGWGYCPVKEGDIIVGLNKGVTAYLPKNVVEEELASGEHKSLQTRLIRRIKTNDTLSKTTAIRGKQIKEYAQAKGDDVAIFLLTI